MESLSDQEEREVAQYEDLRSYANRMVWTINRQIRRLRESLRGSEPNDDFVLQPVSEAEFLIVSLDRLLAVSSKINNIAAGALDDAISEYRLALPSLRAPRNVIAHLDDYLLGEGNDQSVRPGSLSVHEFGDAGVDYGGFKFDLGKALLAAEMLFGAVRRFPPLSYQKAVRLAAERAASTG
jgi:hypothetical protein